MTTPSRSLGIVFQASQLQHALMGQLAAQRNALGWSQSELAGQLDASALAVHRAEAPGGDPLVSTFIEMALALGFVVQLVPAHAPAPT